MKIAVYPGSFDPFHRGHENILDKALKIFDTVYVARGINPLKEVKTSWSKTVYPRYGENAIFDSFKGLLKDYVRQVEACAVIRGLRNIQDFEDEKTYQAYNEEFGLTVPIMYFIADKKLVHVSSTSEKIAEALRKEKPT